MYEFSLNNFFAWVQIWYQEKIKKETDSHIEILSIIFNVLFYI